MSRLSKFTIISASLALAGVAWSGCSESSAGGGDPSQIDTDGVDFPDEDTTEEDDTFTPAPDVQEPDTYVPPADDMVLDFVLVNGDDDNACKGTDRCAIFMSLNSTRTLEVAATQGGAPVENLEIAWDLTKNPNNSMKLNTKTSYTGGDGNTAASVQQTDSQVDQYEVKVSIRNSNVAPIYFDVVVTPKGQVPLTVSYTYKGKRNFQAVTTFLFKQTAQKPFPCSGMNPENLPTADLSSPPKGLTQSTSFPQLPGLEEENEQTWTVVGIGKDVSGPALVWGCDDTQAHVTLVQPANVKIELGNLPPKWKGNYDVTTEFDLVSALPPNVASIVDTVLGFFIDPANQLLVLVCDVGGSVGVINDLCGFVFVDPNAPCTEDTCYESVGMAIKSLVTDLLYDLVQDSSVGPLFFAGQDVAKILKNLELQATITFKSEPTADGTFTTEQTEAEWHSVRYRWTYGTSCEPSDYTCGWHTFNIAAFQDDTIVTSFSGKVEYTNDDDNLLTIDQHSLQINYGALLLYFIKNELLPRLAGDGSDGLPKVDTFAEYLKTLLAGHECLKWENEPQNDNTCCKEFALNLTNTTAGQEGFTTNIAKSACDAAIPLLDQELENLLLDLDLDTGDTFTLATQTPCAAFDHDANMTIDAWGSLDEPCKWETTLVIGGSTINVDNDFWAVEQQ